jgi:thymidine phosphorylase
LTFDAAAFAALVDRVGWAVAEAAALAPADKVLYAMRDATATVGAVPLIVASVLSKKLAAGAPALVFDVKCGRGAFAADETTARDLAGRLVRTATAFGRKAVAVITAMDQPLGYAVGNALEVEGAAAALLGKGAPDLVAVARAVAAEMLAVAGVAGGEQAEVLLTRALETGRAYAKFDEMARAQGAAADWRARLPRAAYRYDVRAETTGTLARLDAYGVAKAAAALGAGRTTMEDELDAAAGVVLAKKEGDAVQAGERVMTLHYNDERRLEVAAASAAGAFTVGDGAAARPLIIDVIR